MNYQDTCADLPHPSPLGIGTCVAFRPDNEEILLVGVDTGAVLQCSTLSTVHALTRYPAHTAAVRAVVWNPHHHKVFISCSVDWTVKVWFQYHLWVYSLNIAPLRYFELPDIVIPYFCIKIIPEQLENCIFPGHPWSCLTWGAPCLGSLGHRTAAVCLWQSRTRGVSMCTTYSYASVVLCAFRVWCRGDGWRQRVWPLTLSIPSYWWGVKSRLQSSPSCLFLLVIHNVNDEELKFLLVFFS